MSWRRHKSEVSAERKRKSDQLLAIIKERGLTPRTNYRDDTILYVGGGDWAVEFSYDSTPIAGRVEAGSYEDLVAIFADDTKYAQWIYVHCREYHRLALEARDTNRNLGDAKRSYGNAAIAVAVADIEQRDDTTLVETRSAALFSLEQAHAAHQQARAAYDAYMAATPQTPEAVAAYLATVAPEQVELGV